MGGVRSLTENSVNFFFFFESFPKELYFLQLFKSENVDVLSKRIKFFLFSQTFNA